MEFLDWLMGLEWWQAELMFWSAVAVAIACLFIPDGIAWAGRFLHWFFISNDGLEPEWLSNHRASERRRLRAERLRRVAAAFRPRLRQPLPDPPKPVRA